MLRMLWVAAYDISDDGQRRRVERCLASVGERAQFSVFEAWLSEHERTRLMDAVLCDITPAQDTDSVRWYGLCGRCQRQLHFLGRGIKPDDPRFYIV